MVHDSGVISCGISDHDIVFIERNVRAPKMKAPPKVLMFETLRGLIMIVFEMISRKYPWNK